MSRKAAVFLAENLTIVRVFDQPVLSRLVSALGAVKQLAAVCGLRAVGCASVYHNTEDIRSL